MRLELKYLAPYLPYGLKCEVGQGGIRRMIAETIMTESFIGIDDVLLYAHKPILRPLSDLTKEIEHNGENFVPLKIINKKTS